MELQKAHLFLLAVSCLFLHVVPSELPGRKSWWASRITDDLYVAGRLTEVQIKYALESGFQSIVSLFTFPTRDYVGPELTDLLPSTSEAELLTASIGLNFSAVLNESVSPANTTWIAGETVDEFSEIYISTPKPVILHCLIGQGAALIALLHLLRTSQNNPNAEAKMDAVSVFQKAADLGYDFAENDDFKNLVLSIDGSLNSTPKVAYPRPDRDLPDWDFGPVEWKVKPLANNLYVTGQLASNELPLLKAKGFAVLVNFRKGVTSGGVASQEESILLNIRDGTGTYDSSGNPVRQMRDTLEANRIDPAKPTTYISENSTYNYQSMNVLQFGDAVGYNEKLQAKAAVDAGLEYHHKPIGGVYKYGVVMWEAYRDSLIEIGRSTSSVLLQSRTGYRAAVVGLLLHGCLYGVGSEEALEMANTKGFPFKDNAVVQLVRDVLDNRDRHCGTMNVASRPGPFTSGFVTMVLLLIVLNGLV